MNSPIFVDVDWNGAIQEYEEYLLIERGLSQNTLSNYRIDLIKLARFYTENPEINPITIDLDSLQIFVYNYSKSKHPRSQARLLSSLKGFFDFLVNEGKRKENPAVLLESPRLGLYLPDTLSVDEVRMLLETCEPQSGLPKRNRAIAETLYGCGLRVSELVRLQLSDLFFEESYVRVFGKGNKETIGAPCFNYTNVSAGLPRRKNGCLFHQNRTSGYSVFIQKRKWAHSSHDFLQ